MAEPTGWIAHYVYERGGEVLTMTTRVLATSRQEAMELAAEAAPADEFVVQLHAESDDQFLGRVRSMVTQALNPKPFDPNDYEEEEI